MLDLKKKNEKSANLLWKVIFIDIMSNNLVARYKIRNEYASICEAISEGYINSMVGDILVITGIGRVKIDKFVFESYNNQIIIKSTLLQMEP